MLTEKELREFINDSEKNAMALVDLGEMEQALLTTISANLMCILHELRLISNKLGVEE